MTHPEKISEKTRLEQEAGRLALKDTLMRSLVAEHVDKLNQRFNHAVRSQELSGTPADARRVRLRVRCADGKDMHFEEAFEEFPSDMMITQLALVCE